MQNISYIKNTHPPKARWTCDIDAIYRNLENIYDVELYGSYLGNDVQLILGGNSYKYNPATFKSVFPNLTPENVHIVSGAGHWVHAEKPEETKLVISNFLSKIDNQKKYNYNSVIYGG